MSDSHPPYLQHHFDTPEQQFDSGKLGMWLFLATEILLFGGLFCAYAVYRGNHPEIFEFAHHHLDTKLGAINTVVLLCSSLTMAWAVRAAQLGQRTLMAILLCLTLAGGFGFMGIKFVEYREKFSHGLLWAGRYAPETHAEGHDQSGDHGETGHEESHEPGAPADDDGASSSHDAAAMPAAGVGFQPEKTILAPPGVGPSGLATETSEQHGPDPKNVQIFFSIYFLMTGLHGAHVVIGMAAIAWILVRGLRGAFSPAYFTPVDLVGLYWHLVDLIWIFLFPLLYLIH